ncbi:hypothetical protein PV327_006543 [Microctonus hyperodae]|uniref:Uncharacterized protein n=1 Tax=Microctonus hyperodae TaxID=165561 RepID=A0AA39F4J0_MICHY|nr:hypothetical protein PV327_006543 [Microctonus hyperodae]
MSSATFDGNADSSGASGFCAAPPPPPPPPVSGQMPAMRINTVEISSDEFFDQIVEDRPSVFSVKNEPGHHQLKQSSPHHQQRWGQPAASNQSSPVNKVIPNASKTQQSSSPTTYIVPIVVEGSNDRTTKIINSPYQQSGPAQNQVNKNVQRTPIATQPESGPVQSRSFRVLQKITDTDGDDVDNEQFRKLQLTEDDKLLMNKFKEQVDSDNYLHQEEDPRYRGAAIPSRAFRYLQNMTDSNEPPANLNEETQANLPPSEQQVQEPKKYTGSAMPSRSFRILQAMTTPETVAKQENHQADFTYQVESNMMPQGNQHGVFIPHYSHQPIYWAYCPVSYPLSSSNQTNNHLHYYPTNNNIKMTNINNSLIQYDNQDTNASSSITNNIIPCALYPVYNQNFYSTINNDVLQEQQQQQQQQQQSGAHCNNLLTQPAWIRPTNEIKTNVNNSSQCDEINFNQIKENSSQSTYNNDEQKIDENWNRIGNASVKKSEVSSMNIIHEETTNQLTKQTDPDDADRSTNDENIHTDSDDSSSSDEISESFSANNAQNNSEIENINDNNNNESSNSESDSDSYLAYSTGLNPRKNDTDNPTMLNEETDDKQNTDCESYMEEEEDEEEVKTENVIIPKKDTRIDTPNEIDSTGWMHIIEEKIKLPDDNETTINIRLPFRFKSPVTQNNAIENPQEKSENNNDVCVNLKIPKEINPSVNFTLKKNAASMRPKSWCPEAVAHDFWTCKTIINNERTMSPKTLDSSQQTINEMPIAYETDQENDDATKRNNISGNIIVKELPQFEVTVEDEENNKIKNDDEELSADESKQNKCLLTVQNSREETDDDDSGVTSDMSRLISEVDTDVECGPTLKKANTYTRTQTHSRLFKLLNDDLVFDEVLKSMPARSNRKNRLSLPLKQSNGFNHDSSNYSSGITSPDYSPVHDSSDWKLLHKPMTDNPLDITVKDHYFKTWKTPKGPSTNPTTSIAPQITETKLSLQSWPYKSKVLCPRIKSSKCVPKTLQNRVKKQSTIHPVPSSIKYDRC